MADPGESWGRILQRDLSAIAELLVSIHCYNKVTINNICQYCLNFVRYANLQ